MGLKLKTAKLKGKAPQNPDQVKKLLAAAETLNPGWESISWVTGDQPGVFNVLMAAEVKDESAV